ncbi:MAG: mannonate dehydratase [Bryobacterales bacterium]|nr:mannonate dehydratase [Bryobacterales bacterium]
MALSRRTVLQSAAASTAAMAAFPGRAEARSTKTSGNKGCFYLTELLNDPKSTDVQVAKQVGVNWVIAGGMIGRRRKEEYMDAVRQRKEEFAAAGMQIAGVEGHPVPFDKIKLGLEGRDEEIENTKWAIEALARNGIHLICYNFMAGLGWTRTNQSIPERGGALTSEFNLKDAEARGLTPHGEVSVEQMWRNCEYFVKEVMPVADKWKVKMALHPDDPPLTPLRGIGRIIINRQAFERVMEMAPSPCNGITFCQANFALMKEDIYALARDWCRRNKIFFVHYRDVEGNAQHFRETFHDNGPTDMVRMLEIYSKGGFVGPIRPDHAPALAGEAKDGKSTGYTMGGKVFAFGYMKGTMDALGLKYT